MQGFVGVMRIYAKHAAILLAIGSLLQFTSLFSPGQAGAEHAAPLQGEHDAPKRPRITGIDHVRLYGSDMEKSREFYTKYVGLPDHAVLGCEKAPHTCFAVTADQQIEILPAGSTPPKNWVAEIAYTIDDVTGMRTYLLAHKANVTTITADPNGARHFELQDPEGNHLSFVQRAVVARDFAIFSNQVGTHVFHAGFVVKNVDTENKFYRDLLGFKLYWHGGFKDDGLDWYEIQVPDGSDWIEYMLNIPANADHKELGVQNHFSLGVKDIHAAAEQLRKNGLTKFDGPEIGRDGKWGLDAYDPDGTRVEFMEPTPARTPCCHAYTAPHPQL